MVEVLIVSGEASKLCLLSQLLGHVVGFGDEVKCKPNSSERNRRKRQEVAQI